MQGQHSATSKDDMRKPSFGFINNIFFNKSIGFINAPFQGQKHMDLEKGRGTVANNDRTGSS
jgi:hypothetical protein